MRLLLASLICSLWEPLSGQQVNYGKLFLDYITPRDGFLPVSEECQEASEQYILGLAEGTNPLHKLMLDSSAVLPESGFFSDNKFLGLPRGHFPGSFSGCLDPKGANGRYCLITIYDYNHVPDGAMPDFPSLEQIRRETIDMTRNEDFITNANGHTRGSAPNPLNGLPLIGKCVPQACTETDVLNGGTNFLYENPNSGANTSDIESTIVAVPLACHTAEEKTEFTPGDIVMIAVLCLFAALILVATCLDFGSNVLGLTYLPTDLLPYLQGFSAYHNSVKIMSVPPGPTDGSNLACLNGLKYISITWVILGHVLWEYTLLGGTYGVMQSSNSALPEASTSMAFAAAYQGGLGVETFFLMGGILLSYHTLQMLDKTKGGNIKMWVHFYVHRIIRIGGLYSILIGLHATLLKFFATGPQSFLIDHEVSKCQKGWWLNLLYINNYARDIYGPGQADCLGVSWYLAIDMQFYILTPFFLIILWKLPKVGYFIFSALLCGGIASQMYLTWYYDDYFHGGLDYYLKPWNRSHPYLIGLMLGYILHKMRDTPKLNINPFLNIWAWLTAAAVAVATTYGFYNYNVVENPLVVTPIEDRIIYNGLEKIAWSVSVGWLILACIKGRGGVINSFLSWSAWVPLARLQYCIYLIHRTIIFIVNSQTEHVIRYSHTLFAFQFMSIVAVSTFAAFVLVILIEAPIVHMEKIMWATLGLGKMPGKRKS